MTKPDAPAAPVAPIVIPDHYNYIAVFLTLACNLRCSYCINSFAPLEGKGRRMSGAEWIDGLNRIVSRSDLPVTLQGGEPSLHPDFFDILNGLRPELNVDILTNLQFDVEEFMRRVAPERVKRDAPYASIRVSYHPEVMDLDETRRKTLAMLERGYSVGIWAVRHPDSVREVERAQEICAADGIDFRFKEFLGRHDGQMYGEYKYDEALSGKQGPPVECRATELIVGPDGGVYRCHGDLYGGRASIGHLCDPDFQIEDVFRPCEAYGFCNPCDIKVKTNRFQKFGHTSVDIRFS